MAKIVPKLNLNKIPQLSENNSFVFAQNIKLDKKTNILRDSGLSKLNLGYYVEDTYVEYYIENIYGCISDNNSLYLFVAIPSEEGHEDVILKYNEITKECNKIECAWKYSGGTIDGKVFLGLNGDTILVICEYNKDLQVPIKYINLNKCKSTDDESVYTQTPNIPIKNLLLSKKYSCQIPKGVYQFFIRYEIAKDFYTNWIPCSSELYAFNSTIKNIVQGTIKYVDKNSDADESFVFDVQTIGKSFDNIYSKFQLGFILSYEETNVARIWKTFSINTSKIYFDYNKSDITEVDINDFFLPIYNLYNVKNVTTFRNKLYVSNYEETNFNPNKESFKLQGGEYKFPKVSYEIVKITPEEETNNSPAARSIFDINDNVIESVDTEFEVPSKDKTLEEDYQVDHIDTAPEKEIIECIPGGYVPNTKDENASDKESIDVPGSYEDTLNKTIDSVSKTSSNTTLLPLEKYKFYIHFVKQNGETTNGYELENTTITTGQTSYFDKNYKCYPKFDRFDIPDGYTAAFISYCHIGNRFIDLHNTGQVIIGKDNKKYLLLDCIEIDAMINPKFNNIKVYSWNNVENKIAKITDNAFYRTSSYFDNNLPTLYGSTGKVLVNIEHDDIVNIPEMFILDEFEISDDSIELTKLTPYNNKNFEVSDLDNFNFQGFISEVYKPTYQELKYFYSGTDIYTKSSDGDLIKFKDRMDMNTSNAFIVRSEFNLKGLILANDVIDINRGYYTKDTTETITTNYDTSYETSGVIKESDWDNFNHKNYYIIINDYVIKEKDVGRTKFYTTLTEDSYPSYNDNNICYYISLQIFQSLCDVTSDDIGKKVRRVFCCNKENIIGRRIVTKYIKTSVIKKTIKTDAIINSNTYKTVETLGWVKNYILDDGNGGIIPDVIHKSSIPNIDQCYDEGFLPEVGSYEKATDVSIDSSENTSELSNYQNYSYVESLTLSSLYKLPASYKDYLRKTYEKIADNTITKFENTIRSSNSFGDESETYIFKFYPNDYYNVDTSKGIIVNLAAVGNYILVHTKDSLFNFSGQNSLQTLNGEAQLKETDVFDTGIQEVIGSDKGYCGLQEKHHAIITQTGYIFYDASVKKIYIYSGQGSIQSLSDDIDKILKQNNLIDAHFLNDYYNDRFFVSLIYENYISCTLSFNYLTSSFISTHSFTFENSICTKTKGYVFNESVICVLDNSSFNYSDFENIHSLLPILTIEGEYAVCAIDVIYNENYEKVKCLDSLSWTCNKINTFLNDNTFMAEERFVSRVPGDVKVPGYVNPYPCTKLQIYTDSCHTEEINAISNDLNGLNDYEYPRFNKGIWSFNYFRNVENSENEQYSDMKSLIYGKYFVVRFIFNRNVNFKFENVKFNINDNE